MIKLAPSILSAKFDKLGEEVTILDKSVAEYIHIDVMDGSFVPSITVGPKVIRSIRKYTDKAFDVHLMANNPEAHIEKIIEAGADIVTVHLEACPHLNRTVQKIKRLGAKAGVSLNPSTSLTSLDYILEYVDMILLMTVNPGEGGQEFIENSLRKITDLKRLIDDRNLDVDIEVDGGINQSNIIKIINAGANVIVVGSAVFGDRTAESLEELYKLIKEDNK